jgi:hypothetical protein
MKMIEKQKPRIVLSEANRERLSRLGHWGETADAVIGRALDALESVEK